METETISFRTGLEGLEGTYPGSIIQTTDSVRSGERVGGRIISATTTEVVLDASVTLDNGVDYTFWAVLPDGTVESQSVVTTDTTTDTLEVSAFSAAPQEMAVWVLASASLVPEQWRVISITEVDGTQAEISAIEYRSDKYDAVEDGLLLEPLEVSTLTTVPDAPTNLVAEESLYLVNPSVVGSRLSLSWSGNSPLYVVSWRYNGDNWTTVESLEPSYDVQNTKPGDYEIRVTAVNSLGIRSTTTSLTTEVYGLLTPPADVTGFYLNAISGSAYLSWQKSADLDVLVGGYIRIRHSKNIVDPKWSDSVDIGPAISGSSTSTTLPLLTGSYLAKWVDSSGLESSNFATITTNAPSVVNMNFVELLTEDPDFLGAKGGAILDVFGADNALILDDLYTIASTPTTEIPSYDNVLHMDFVDRPSLTPRKGTATFPCTRAGATATRVNESGLIEVVAADTARFDYDPVTLECRGLFAEESRTNLAYLSEQLTSGGGGGWLNSSSTNIVIYSDTDVAPDGTVTADTVSDESGASTGRVQQNRSITSSSNTYCLSWFIKKTTSDTHYAYINVFILGGTAVSRSITVDTNSGAITFSTAVNSGVEDYGDYWRVWMTSADNASGNNTIAFALYPAFNTTGGSVSEPSLTGSKVAWGCQVEVGAAPSSYIPTPTTAAVTRNADQILCTDISGFHNVSECTVFVEAEKQYISGATAYPRLFSLSNPSLTDQIASFVVEVDGAASGYVRYDSASQASMNTGAITAGEVFRMAIAYKANDFATSRDGVASVADTSGTMPTVDRMGIGQNGGGGNIFNGHIRRLVYWPSRLTNAQLEEISNYGIAVSGVESTGDYLFYNDLDLGEVYVSRLYSQISSFTYNTNNLVDSWGLIDDLTDIDGENVSTCNATIYVRTTESDPVLEDWSDWQPFFVGEWVARAFQFKLVLESNNITDNIAVTELSVQVDMPDTIYSEEDIVSGTLAYSVVYPKPFFAEPAIAITAQEMATGDYYEVTNKSPAGFDVAFKNSGGTGISRTFDYIARGY
jgi:hypothetical protein